MASVANIINVDFSGCELYGTYNDGTYFNKSFGEAGEGFTVETFSPYMQYQLVQKSVGSWRNFAVESVYEEPHLRTGTGSVGGLPYLQGGAVLR
jgi:hypothetical protein